ncbi:cyclic nucleotide-binding domain-containing protein [candidate division KSB1 bacterium]|nr:MAG: cyclic nucleotide-binding domain-containing protein [candidate division KSB1 bacterium]
METIEPLLAEHPLFQGMSSEHLKLLVGCAKNVRFNEGEIIFREDGEADVFYVVRKGMVALDAYLPGHGAVTLTTLTDGDTLGWSWLIPPYRWHFDARAVKMTLAIALDAKCLRTKCENDHELDRELLRRFVPIMVDRMEAVVMQLLDLYSTRRVKG